ncbi:hypothetical protein EJ05DRAFT_514945 [Pseudovirgaria hyperparasitica]|uniref:Uncharacterized protein n=1 Tax=Pseudovirgaria hyperparasitica TaxID=470096 RepID=A0A6A6VW53_9PEZI|nr:uncharacterized protein EJ05DRAFT_514945 [Pseudovirgaria hyperparasitica]KAF2753477.1 hypothetical protein EJ05DRAFT_514945 [Pseudovirgaria hyperparasitica]
MASQDSAFIPLVRTLKLHRLRHPSYEHVGPLPFIDAPQLAVGQEHQGFIPGLRAQENRVKDHKAAARSSPSLRRHHESVGLKSRASMQASLPTTVCPSLYGASEVHTFSARSRPLVGLVKQRSDLLFPFRRSYLSEPRDTLKHSSHYAMLTQERIMEEHAELDNRPEAAKRPWGDRAVDVAGPSLPLDYQEEAVHFVFNTSDGRTIGE